MPIYEYSCSKCGKTIEVIQKMSDKPLRTHAGCGGKLEKLISASGFQFKGTGWYVTDYAKKSQPESSESSKETKTDPTKATTSTGSGPKEKPAASTSSEKTEKSDKSSSSGKTKKT